MIKPMVDQQALVDMFASASVKQGEALRQAVSAATMKALQSREVTLEGVKKVVGAVAGAASAGAARNAAPVADVEKMLGSALSGIDSALLQVVEANRKAIEQFVERGSSLTEKPMQDALATVEKMEDAFFAAVAKAGQSAGTMRGPWDKALASFKDHGSETGAQAEQMTSGMMEQARSTLRDSRAAGLHASQAMLSGYAAMVNGILIGMSEGMQHGAARAAAPSAAPAPAAAAKTTRKRS